MASKASLLEDYSKMTTEERVDYISKNYSSFMGVVESFTEGLIYMIEEEQNYNRQQDKGDLGVRVQGGPMRSDKTANAAIRNVTIRDAIINCDFSGGILEDTDHAEKFMEMAATLHRMRREFRLFDAQISSLPEVDSQILRAYLNREKDFYAIADDLGVTYDSARQRVRRVRHGVKVNMLDFINFSFI